MTQLPPDHPSIKVASPDAVQPSFWRDTDRWLCAAILVLLLLVIFMVAAPLATVGVKVDLPASTAASQPRSDKPIHVTLKSDLSLDVGNDVVARENLSNFLDRVSGKNKEARIVLRADKSVDYDELMRVINLLSEAGYVKVGLEAFGADMPSAPADRPGSIPAGAVQ